MMKHMNRSTLLLLSLLLSSSFAFAGKVAPKGYLVDSANDPVKSGFGLCWHTGTWTPADAVVEGCDDMLKQAPAPAAAPKAEAEAPASTPAPATATSSQSSDAAPSADARPSAPAP